jgi:N-methylhydantoinase A/oxoprolinase/acetone carboxylase beta subunit
VVEPLLRIGIDVGGTNTDAVVVDGSESVIASAKVPTSADVTSGIVAALRTVLAAPDVDPLRVGHIMLGTTHATNAVLERRQLRRVAALRVAGPATRAIPLLAEWPDDLVAAVSAGSAIVDGGSEISGTPSGPLDREAVKRFLGTVGDHADAVAITGLFAPISNDVELEVQAIVHDVLGEITVSLSHGIGSLGLIERENATVLNAALSGVAESVAAGISTAVEQLGLHAVVYFAQNDGTLMDLDYVVRYPVLTIGSGPANSMRGAAHLSGLDDAIVIDVGGTSTDIGILVGGFPRESARAATIGGIRTNFRMPDLVSVALGGGTIVTSANGGGTAVGPERVGYRIGHEALVFGGSTPTLTDAAVASGRARLGDESAVTGSEVMLRSALATADAMITEGIEAMKTASAAVPLIAVGGGSLLLAADIDGITDVIRPRHHDVANAFGAAISAVSGEVDRIYRLDDITREDALDQARAAAVTEAIRAGADPQSVEMVRLEVVPVAYVAQPTVRVRAKAAGALRIGGQPHPTVSDATH